MDRFTDEGSPVALGEFAALGGEAFSVMSDDGASMELPGEGSGRIALALSHLANADSKKLSGDGYGLDMAALKSAKDMGFVALHHTASPEGSANDMMTAESREMHDLEIAGCRVWVYELDEIRGAHRTVATIQPMVEAKGDNVHFDGRFNVSFRARQLVEIVSTLREQFKDTLSLVVAPRGFFGFQGRLPVWTSSDEENIVEARGEMVETTVGRVLFYNIVPPELPFAAVDRPMSKKALGELIDRAYRVVGPKRTVLFADSMMRLGFKMAAESGISICIDDMQIPSNKQEMLDSAQIAVRETETQYNEGLITPREKYNKVVDIWSKVTTDISDALLKNISEEEVLADDGRTDKQPSFNSIFMMVDSGARGSPTQVRQLAGMRGLMAKPSGEIIEQPITANFREGLTVLQYFISTHGARKGLADTALKTANSGYLTRRLVDVVQDTIITAIDCGTTEGVEVTSLIEGGEIIEQLGERILGRIAVDDILDPYSDETLAASGSMLDEAAVERVVQAGVESVNIRSVLSCEMRWGICAMCYGRDLARGNMVNIGEAVGVIAAQSIGEPGTQLTMRTFHIGGAASSTVAQSYLELRTSGFVRFSDALSTTINREANVIAMSRNGEVTVVDNKGRERERYGVPYGAQLLVKDGQKCTAKMRIAQWDPFNLPIIANVAGEAKFEDLEDGRSMKEEIDVTGLSRMVVTDYKDTDLKPRIVVRHDGKIQARYFLPVNAYIMSQNGGDVALGDVLAKIPRETTKTKDITGGLPRVAELFEARKPKEIAVITEVDGTIEFGKDTKGKRRIVVVGVDGERSEYLIPKGKNVTVNEGDYVRAGEALMDGAVNPHDILKVKGEGALARYLVDEVQEVYRLQGVKINDKHIEVIVRQMLKRVKIREVGDTEFLLDEVVDKFRFERVNRQVMALGGLPSSAEPLLLGITKASLSTDSFLSAASFQETTRVLTEAAIKGATDELRGCKENVIMGRLIPAGTGFTAYEGLAVNRQDEENEELAPPIAT
jgi:DNA-directed RNA polymerase subunit beta'